MYAILYEQTNLPNDIIQTILSFNKCIITNCDSYGDYLLDFYDSRKNIAIDMNYDLKQFYCLSCYNFIFSEITNIYKNQERRRQQRQQQICLRHRPRNTMLDEYNFFNRFIINEDSFDTLYNVTDLPIDLINIIRNYNDCCICHNQGVIKLYTDEEMTYPLNRDNFCFYCQNCHNIVLENIEDYYKII